MGAMHAGMRPAPPNTSNTLAYGPSWQYGILPFMEQRNIYDKIANTIRVGGNVTTTGGGIPFSANIMNTAIAGRPLDKLVPDYMRCPSSPLPVMTDQTGSICLPTYVGIAGGVDITTTNNPSIHPNPNLWGNPTSTRSYQNRHGCIYSSGGVTSGIMTNSGMLPVAEHKGMNNCTDGTSNTMIVGEQSDWLRSNDRTNSTKYHGDPGWGGPASPDWSTPTGTDQQGGWLTGTNIVNKIPELPAGSPCNTAATTQGWDSPTRLHNVTTVRYKPHLKEVIGGTQNTAPGCAEIGGDAWHGSP